MKQISYDETQILCSQAHILCNRDCNLQTNCMIYYFLFWITLFLILGDSGVFFVFETNDRGAFVNVFPFQDIAAATWLLSLRCSHTGVSTQRETRVVCF